MIGKDWIGERGDGGRRRTMMVMMMRRKAEANPMLYDWIELICLV